MRFKLSSTLIYLSPPLLSLLLMASDGESGWAFWIGAAFLLLQVGCLAAINLSQESQIAHLIELLDRQQERNPSHLTWL